MSAACEGFRQSVERRLVEAGYVRDLARMIAALVPTFFDVVKRFFEGDGTATAESVGLREELFAVHEGLWFCNLEAAFHRAENKSTDWVSYDHRVRSFIRHMEDEENQTVEYLSPELTPGQTVLRLLVGHRDALAIILIYTAKPEDHYRRLHERLILFLHDLKIRWPDDPYINGWAKDLLATPTYSQRPYRTIREILLPHSVAVISRDEKLFEHVLPYPQINAHIQRLWAQTNRSPKSREAIWRAIEDLFDLVLIEPATHQDF